MQPLLGEEQEKPRRSKAYLAFFLGAVVLSVAAFAFMLIGPLSGLETPADTGHSLTRLLHKLDSSSRIAHFVEHKDYMSLDPQYDGLWSDDLLTPNGGYVIMDKETNKTDKMGISMFHQLHCLAMIRDEMQYLSSIIDAVKEAAIFKGEWEPKEPVERRHGHKSNMDLGNPGHHGQTHVLHCFDYLRQVRSRCIRVTRGNFD